jgi:hypothetical protein
MVELIETLQQDKLTQISKLQACFSTCKVGGNCQAVDTHESNGADMLQSESFRIENDDDGNVSDASFEDLRV